MTKTETTQTPLGEVAQMLQQYHDEAKKPAPPAFMSEEVNEISVALANIQGEAGNVVKNLTGKVKGKNKKGDWYEYEYKYAGLDAVIDAVRKHAKKEGLAIIQRSPASSPNLLHTLLVHKSGQWIDFGVYPLGNADKHQERGSALTYGRRYTLSNVFAIAGEEDDDGARGNDSLGRTAPRATPTTQSGVFKSKAEKKRFQAAITSEFAMTNSLDMLGMVWKREQVKIKALETGDENDQEFFNFIKGEKDRHKARIHLESETAERANAMMQQHEEEMQSKMDAEDHVEPAPPPSETASLLDDDLPENLK